MKLKKIHLLVMLLCFSLYGFDVHSAQLNKDELEIYGKLHVSANRMDNGKKTGTSISSNASRIGFKGRHKTPKHIDLIWQLEQTVRLDEANGNLATRNSYLGIASNYGDLLVGHNDTPYKIVAGYWGLFSDLVPDRLALLGASMLDNVKMNDRGENAIFYKNKMQAWELQAMYSASNPTAEDNDTTDDNSAVMRSYALMYRTNTAYLGVGFEQWDGMAVTNIQNSETERAILTGVRLAAYYWISSLQIGFVYEKTEADDLLRFPHWDKEVYGISALYRINSDFDIAMHSLKAKAYANSEKTGAQLNGIGLFFHLDSQSDLYLAWAQTNNDENATYKVADGGHGDTVKPYKAGEDPAAISLGMIFSF
ncbi:MAG: porin [Gammaproteobacteria bacterium]|nr:porin [Gammaproteobacteria bacterium]